MERAAHILKCYEEISRFSVQMLDAARHGQWDDLVALERNRESLVAELEREMSQGVVPVQISRQVAELISAILKADAETKTLAESWKGELKDLLDSMSTERKLSQTYGP